MLKITYLEKGKTSNQTDVYLSQKLFNTLLLDTYFIPSSHQVLASPYPIALSFNMAPGMLSTLISSSPNDHLHLLLDSSTKEPLFSVIFS